MDTDTFLDEFKNSLADEIAGWGAKEGERRFVKHFSTDKLVQNLKEEEERKKHQEYIRMKEWEEKFDRIQKEKELEENRKELKLRQKELEKNRSIEPLTEDKSNLTLELERFDVDKNTKN